MKRFTLFLIILLSGITLKAQVINENFDASTSFPEGWQKIVKSSASYYDITINTSSYYSNSLPNSVKFYTYTASDTLMLISPEVDLTAVSSYKLSANIKGSTGNQMEIGKMTDPANLSTYTPIDTLTLDGYSFAYYERYIYPNELTHLVFKRLSGSLYMDDILVEAVLPYNVKLETISSQESILTGSSSNFKILVKNLGTNNSNIDLSVVTNLNYTILDKTGQTEITSINLDGLTSDTILVNVTASEITEGIKDEIFNVMATVREDITKEDDVTINFKTYTPYIEIEEGFEDGALPFAWSIAGEDGKVKFYKSSYSAFSGEGYTQFSATGIDSASMLISPAITGYEGDYKVTAQIYGSDNIEVGIITDLNDWSSYSKVGSLTGGGYAYAENQVVLPDFTNDAYMVFKYVGSSYSTVRLDEVDIERSEDYAIDIKTDFTEGNGYTTQSLYYPVYMFNKGILNETYNILVDCSWDYKILKTDSITEVTSLDIAAGANDTVYVVVNIPSKGIMNGEENSAKVKIECKNNTSNFEEAVFTTKASLLSTYMNEAFEDIDEFPANWNMHGEPGTYGTSTVEITSSDSYEGAQSAKIYQSSGATKLSYFTTPMFKSSSDAYTLSFWARATSATADVHVGTISDPNDFSTFEVRDTLTATVDYQHFSVSGLNLSEAKSFLIGQKTESKVIYIDSLVIKQDVTTVEFNPAEGTKITVVNPDLFVKFSKPVMLLDGSDIIKDNIDDIVQLKKETVDGENIELNFTVSEDKQTIKSSPVQHLNGTSYHILLNSGLKDIDGNNIEGTSIYFNVEDFFAPEFVEGYPFTENIAETTFDIKLQANENATVYYVLLPKSETEPTAAEIKAGVLNSVSEGNKQVVANDNEVISINGLESKVSYDLYLTLEDNAGNLQETTTKIEVSTLDLTAPEFSEGYPWIENITETSLDISLQISENGKVYFILIAAESDVPTSGQVKTGVDYSDVILVSSNNGVITASTDLIFSITGLESKTTYDLYAVAEDEDGNLQELPSKVTVSTLDLTAPEFATAYPVIENILETTLDISLKTNEVGKAYYLIVSEGTAAPTASQVKAGIDYDNNSVVSADSKTVEANSEVVFSVTGLESFKAYDIYVVAEDNDGNLQDTPVKLTATTLDLTAPVFAENYPSVDLIKENSFNVYIKSNENATAYLIVIESENSNPESETIRYIVLNETGEVNYKAKVDLVNDTEAIIEVNGLNKATDYDIIIVLEDEHGNLQEEPVKVDIKTDGQVTTSIESIIVNVKVYPNPAEDFIKIQCTDNMVSYTVLNSIGNVVRVGKIKSTSELINVNNLHNGLYFIVVKSESGKEIVKRVIVE